MPPNSISPTEEARKLADFLRKNPEASTYSSQLIAEAAGVSTDLTARVAQTAKVEKSGSRRSNGALNQANKVSGLLDRIVAQTHMAVVLSTIAAIVTSVLIAVAENHRDSLGVTGVTLILGTVILHWIVYFRSGSIAVTLRSSASFTGLMMLLAVFLGLVTQEQGMKQSDIVTSLISVMMLMAMIYTGISLLFCSLGGYLKMRSERQELERMSRFELIGRLFDIEDRLKAADNNEPSVASRPTELSDHISKNPIVYAFVMGVLIGLLMVIVVPGDISARVQANPNAVPSLLILVVTIISICSSILQITISYFAKGMVWSLAASFTYWIATVLTGALPINGYGIARMGEVSPSQWILAATFAIVFGLVGGLGGIVGDYAIKQRLSRENNPEQLLAEMIEIHRLLTPIMRSVTIMVVDAVKSSVMKTNSDPLVAEWSFRAYQMMLERITHENGGTVFATAGDGATMIFDDAMQAVQAGWQIQREINIFNLEVNRLNMPFKLRIGIHTGQVQGHVERVMYSEVIDVAAHVEGAGTPGSVAVSDATLSALGPIYSTSTGIHVDGFAVHSVFQPS